MENLVDFIQRHNSKIQGVSGTIAAMGLDKTAGKALGKYVTPAVWALNYSASGAKPGEIDLGLFALGLNSFLALPATIVSLFKAAVDDKTNQQVAVAKIGEDPKYSRFLLPCSVYAMGAPAINALSIASKGGTAWQHPNGVWVFILDAEGKMVSDFKPNKFTMMYQPNQPLVVGASGKFNIVSTRGH